MDTSARSHEPAEPGSPVRVLLAEPPGASRSYLEELLRADPRAQVVVADDARTALELLTTDRFGLCLADLGLGEPGAMGLARELRRRRRPIRVIVTADEPTVEDAVQAIRAGADDFLPKRADPGQLRHAIEMAAREEAAHTPDQFHGVVSRNARMHAIFTLVQDVGPTAATVLIQGETGTGKEQLARAIHAASVGRAGAFVAVNCAAVPATLLEAELFGHEKGAFTGAERQRVGKFELAHGGTIFIDEAGDVPAMMQVKLLRVLQERRFERVGGIDPLHVDVRVIAATNRSLRRMVRRGQFREDLYYRLNVVRIDLPPLRARPEDIPVLVTHFCRKYARAGAAPKEISAAALERLARYHWPGNVRELENAIERACVIHPSPVIEPAHLPPELNRATGAGSAAAIDIARPLKELLRDLTARLEKRYIVKALRKTRGHVGRAAKICGYCRRSLTAKIAEYHIDRLAFTART